MAMCIRPTWLAIKELFTQQGGASLQTENRLCYGPFFG
jgi:hypothetical protein